MSFFTGKRLPDGVLLAAGVLLCIGVFADQVIDIVRGPVACDFDDYYYSTKAFRDSGVSLYDHQAMLAAARLEGRSTDLAEYVYPPYLNLVFLPLVGFRYEPVRIFWLTLNYLLLFATMLGLRRLCEASTGARPGWRLTWLFPVWALSLFSPLIDHNVQGQSNLLILCLLTWGIHFEMRGRVRSGGLFIAAASLLKLFPVVLWPYYVVTRRFRSIAWMIAGAALVTAITCAFIPPAEFLRFPSVVLGSAYATSSGWYWGDLSASNAIARVLPGLAPSGSLPNLVLRLIPYAALLGRCARERSGPDSQRIVRIAQLVTLFGFFMTRWWEHHLVLLLFPFFVAFHEALRARPIRRLPFCLAVVSCVYIGAVFHPWLRTRLESEMEALMPFKFVAILVLFAALELLAHPLTRRARAAVGT